MNPLHYLALIRTSVKRYIQIDLNYKFQIATDIVDLILTIVAFTVLGAFVDDAASPEELGINYNLQGFLFIGVFFWAFFQRAYEDTVETIPEEASRGTVGFLVTNNVNLSTLLISRNVASMVKTILMALIVVLPVLVVIDYVQVRDSPETTRSSALELWGPEESKVIVQDRMAYFQVNGSYVVELGGENGLNLSQSDVATLGALVTYINFQPNWSAALAPQALASHATTRLLVDEYETQQTQTLYYDRPSKAQSLFSGFSLVDLPLILLVFALIWLFMLAVSVLVASLNILSKKVRPFAVMIITLLKVISGYWFPIEAMREYGQAYEILRQVPIVTGLIFLRDMVLVDQELTWGQIWSLYLQPILGGTLMVAAIALVVYKVLERKSQRWGTLEFY